MKTFSKAHLASFNCQYFKNNVIILIISLGEMIKAEEKIKKNASLCIITAEQTACEFGFP